MKKAIYLTFTLFFLISISLVGCELNILETQTEFDQKEVLKPESAPLLAAGMIETSFDAAQTMWYMAGLINENEIRALQAGSVSGQIVRDGKATESSTLNRAATEKAYQALATAQVLSDGLAGITFSDDPAVNNRCKDLLMANVAFTQSFVYANMSRYYDEVRVYGSGNVLTPDSARALSINFLSDARDAWNDYALSAVELPFSTDGLLIGGDLFVAAFGGMIWYDAGNIVFADSILSVAGYLPMHDGAELALNSVSSFGGAGVYMDIANYFVLGSVTFSDSLIAAKIPGDTLRGDPAKWFENGGISYFLPSGAMPIVSWEEVALMRADLSTDPLVRAGLMQQVLNAWQIENPDWILADTSWTPKRIARFAHLGKGRQFDQQSDTRWALPFGVAVANADSTSDSGNDSGGY